MVGKPDMTVVAFGSHSLNVYQINDAMTERGWSLNALQRPARWGGGMGRWGNGVWKEGRGEAEWGRVGAVDRMECLK